MFGIAWELHVGNPAHNRCIEYGFAQAMTVSMMTSLRAMRGGATAYAWGDVTWNPTSIKEVARQTPFAETESREPRERNYQNTGFFVEAVLRMKLGSPAGAGAMAEQTRALSDLCEMG